MKTQKISARIPANLAQWIADEADRRKCPATDVITDAIRLGATAGKLAEQQSETTELLRDLVPLFDSRIARLENYIMQSVCMSGAVAKNDGVYQSALDSFQAWKERKGGQK